MMIKLMFRATIVMMAMLAGSSLHCGPARAAPAAAATPAPTRFSVTTEGKGPDAILIPGLTSSRAVWDGAVAGLGGKYRVHRIQIAGFAGDPAGPNAQGELLPAIVEELDSYIAARKLKRPAVVGHSMGGLLGLMLASKHPQSVGKLLVVDALPFYSMLMGPGVTAESVKPQAAQMRDALAAMPKEAYEAQLGRTMAMLVKTDRARPALAAAALASDRGVASRAVYEDMITDMRPSLPVIRAPLTIAYATNAFAPDAVMGPLYRSGYAGAAQAKLVRIDDSYHFAMIDQPDRFQAVLAEFLAGK
jgi:pimeloyl-ACP methyl ester carboxylesterase